MNTRDRIGLWADDQLNDLYFRDVPFKALRENVLNLLVPVCGHKDFETGKECSERGEPCFLGNYGSGEEDDVEWFCYEHMHVEGFCRGCRQFWAGCEDFDFDPHGLCSNCRHNPDVTGEDDYYDDEYWSYEL